MSPVILHKSAPLSLTGLGSMFVTGEKRREKNSEMEKAQKEGEKRYLHYASPLRPGIFLRRFDFILLSFIFDFFPSPFYSYSYFAESKIGPSFI